MRTFVLAADHGGFNLKQVMLKALAERFPDYKFIDLGCHDTSSVDYPDYAALACREVLANKAEAAILFCGTGIGISIAANKLAGIRCAHLSDCYSANKCKEHNNANAISLGGRVIGEDLALEIITAYLNAKFQGDRHARRIAKITALEQEFAKQTETETVCRHCQ